MRLRPLLPEDAPAVHEAMVAAFRDLAARLHEDPSPPGDPAASHLRIRHLARTDPGGAWLAEEDGQVVGAALALVREGLWGLSLLVVRPAAQSQGIGRALLARALAHGNGARGRVILASSDARALRAYARAGLTFHPSAVAEGVPRDVAMPAGVRPLEPGDREMTDAVGRLVRGAPHGEDLEALREGGSELLVVPGEGYAAHRSGEVKLLAARSELAARTLLRAMLARTPDGSRASVWWLTGAQRWAVDVALEAGLACGSTAGSSAAGTPARSPRISPAGRTSDGAAPGRSRRPLRLGCPSTDVALQEVARFMAMQSRSLHGRVAVITGGGRGIGRALALALTREGCRVAIGDVDEAAAAAVAREAGGETLGLRLDVTDRPGFTAFLDEVERRLGPIEVLVNNAGIMPVGPFESEDDATVIRILEIDLHAVLHGSKEAVRRMRPRGSGHIVNVASIAGRVGFPNLATYSAAKHGVIGLSEALRQELRGTGVDVSVVMPAIVRTELAAGLRPSRGFKPSTPEEVAEAIVEALRKNRFDVYVPRSLGPTWVGMIALPRRAREALARAMQIYGAALDTDHSTRAAYEARAAASAPATDAVIAEAAAEPDSREQAAA